MQLYPCEQFNVHKAPWLVVDSGTFRRLSAAAGWDDYTIELFLRPPVFSGFVKVGQMFASVVANGRRPSPPTVPAPATASE